MTAQHSSLTRCARKPLSIAIWVGLIGILGIGDSPAFNSADDYFRDPTLNRILLSPAGDFLAASANQPSHGTRLILKNSEVNPGMMAILIRHNDTKTTDAAVSFGGHVWYFQWADDDTFIVSYRDGGINFVRVIDVAFADGQLDFTIRSITAPGNMIDGIEDHEDEILWARSKDNLSTVYKSPLSMLTEPKPKRRKPWAGLKSQYIVAQLEGIVVWWITDRDGVVRAALGLDDKKEPEAVLWYRESMSTAWRELYRTDDVDEVIVPIGIAPDNRNLLVLSNKKSDTVALVEFSVDTSELGKVLFSHPSADVVDIMYDFNGMEVLSAAYEESGLRKYHHFDTFSDRFQRSLEHAFPGQSISITSTSRDSRYLSVFVSSPRNPGTFYVLNTETRTASFVDRIMPWIDPEEMSDAQAFQVTSRDGTKIEAFLTTPVDGEATPPPLLVLPHGGPWGVRDSREFDPLVQYIASWGIAVLQVNFRGSAGYGKTFFEAGFRQHSTGIEDDIEAAVELVLSKGLVDGNRMCIAGMSYGGYSAIVSAIRTPDRYQCAATVAGVSDVPLFLNSDGRSETEEGRTTNAKLIGDPKAEYERLVSISPAYHADEIEIPVLIIHGTEDRRVDIEHAYRLKAMLDVHGKSYVWHPLEGAGHSPNRDQWIELAMTLHSFIDDHLNPVAPESDGNPEN